MRMPRTVHMCICTFVLYIYNMSLTGEFIWIKLILDEYSRPVQLRS